MAEAKSAGFFGGNFALILFLILILLCLSDP